MNNLMIILMALLLLSTMALAQSSTDTTGDKKVKEIDKKSDFIDENANGVDDRMEQQQGVGKQRRMRDRFVDLDGDGICDGRQGGVGIRARHSDKQTKQGGQKHQGNR